MKLIRKKQQNPKPKTIRQHREISIKAGLPPESLVHVGHVYLEKTLLDLITFNKDNFTRSSLGDPDAMDKIKKFEYTWLNVNGLHDVSTIEALGRKFNISQLMLEDVLNTSHRPKLEEDASFLFFTLKSFQLDNIDLQAEQVSFILGKDMLISFQESDKPYFDAVLNRLANSSGKIRSRGLDYLLYNLIDVIVDHYYSILEKIGDQLEELEEEMFEKPEKELVDKNQQIRKNVIALRKALVPTQEALNKLIKEEPESIDDIDLPYFSDLVDHLNQGLDFIDTYRDLSAEIKESYLSSLSYRMNQVIKLLTIITTIFIPLTFIAGIYGMNFVNMPELQWKYGYFVVLGVMFLLMMAMLVYFRKKKWI